MAATNITNTDGEDAAPGPALRGAPMSVRARLRHIKERVIEMLLFLAAFSSVAVTAGIVGVLVYESSSFFAHVPLVDFFTDTLWTPLFASPRFGILPLVAGTMVTT